MSNVPLLVIVPETVRVFVEGTSKEAAELTVRFVTSAEASSVTVTPLGIVTLADEEGTPPHQLPAVFQLPVEKPIQVPEEIVVELIDPADE